MTNREQEILSLIRKNRLISQDAIAEALGITRSSVAVHITNLMKKGYIAGRGYVLPDETLVCVVGGANIDIAGFPREKLAEGDSTPGRVTLSLGGVGRNIAENLVRLGVATKLISVMGDDFYGRKILDEGRRVGIDMDDSLVISGQPTSTYLAMLDHRGDLRTAISQMDVLDQLGVDFLRAKRGVLERAQVCVVDTNVPVETIEYIAAQYRNRPLFLDTVSTVKALKATKSLGSFHTIKPNKIEAETLWGQELTGSESLRRCADCFLSLGVKRVFISLGAQGVYYDDGRERAHLPPSTSPVVNATGAGDAFMAGLVYGYSHGFDIHLSARFAMAAAALTLSHPSTINPQLSVHNVMTLLDGQPQWKISST